MVRFQYLRFIDGDALPILSDFAPFKALVIIETGVTDDWQEKASKWLVSQGCLYMLAWGQGSSSWDDSVDCANIEKFLPQKIPDDHFVITTWHDNDSIEEVVEFAAKAALHRSKKLNNYLFFHVSDKPREDEFKNFFSKYVK